MSAAIASLFESVAETVRRSVVRVDSGHGTGAGTAWGPGLVVTNRHVARGETAVVDGAAARVIAADDRLDLALLSATGMEAPALARRQEPARAGELVLAVGHPWGLQGSVAAGVVAAELSDGDRRVLRADIRLAPGNSGGPLVDARGRLLGLNTMVAGGMGLAIPVADVESFVAGALGQAGASEAAAG